MKDKILLKFLRQEIKRQNETLNLIPSENIGSPEVLSFLGSPLANKYAEGYPGARYYGGNQWVDEIEKYCQKLALKTFKLSSSQWSVNVQPYSGSPANLAVYAALVPLGEKIMGLRLDMGGHLTHGHKVSFTGKAWQAVSYGLDQKTEELDFKAIRKLAIAEKPKLIVAGFTAYPQLVNWRKFKEIADAIGAIFMVDMSHIAGLIAGGVYPSPFSYADVVTSTTHKTLRGPRAALVFSRGELSKAIDRSVFPGLQGGPHVNQIAATAQALFEAGQPSFRRYAKQIVKNAKALAEELKKDGWRLVSGGTATHLLLMDVAAVGLGGKVASDLLENEGIIVNKNTIPFDSRPPTDPSGIRLGTPALTTRGMKEKEMRLIAKLITVVLRKRASVKPEVRTIAKKFPLKYISA